AAGGTQRLARPDLADDGDVLLEVGERGSVSHAKPALDRLGVPGAETERDAAGAGLGQRLGCHGGGGRGAGCEHGLTRAETQARGRGADGVQRAEWVAAPR